MLGLTLVGEIVKQEAAVAKAQPNPGDKDSSYTNSSKHNIYIFTINEHCIVAMTPETSEELIGLLATLEGVANDFSTAEIAEVSATLTSVNEADTLVSSASEAIEAKEVAQNEIAQLELLLTTIQVLEEMITELFVAMASVTSTEIIETTAITDTVTLIQSFQVQAFTEAQVLDIKSFETEATQLLEQLQAGTGVLEGLDILQAAVGELSITASAALDEMVSNQAINENFDILSNVETLVELIIEKTEILKESATGSDTAGEETILLIIEFLKSFSIASVTANTEIQLNEFVASMTSLVEEGTGSFSSLDELLAESNAVKEAVSTKLAEAKVDMQALEILEEKKTIAELTAEISTQLTELSGKINPESSAGPNPDLEDTIKSIIMAMQQILSGSMETTTELQTLLGAISSQVSTVAEISVVAGLEQSIIITSNAVEFTESEVENLETSFDETRSLATLDKALQLSNDIKTFITTTLTQDEGGKNSAAITQLQGELSKWQQVQLIKEESIQTVLGFFESVKVLSTEFGYAGLTELTGTIDSVQEAINGEITATMEAKEESKASATIESAQTLITESKTTLLQLQEITDGFTEEVASEEVNSCIDMFNQLISDGVSEGLVSELETALEELKVFVTSFDASSEVGVLRLQESIDLATEAKESIDRLIDQAAAEEDNDVVLLTDAQLQVTELLSLLGQLSAGETEEKNNGIDEVKELIVELKENVGAISEETIQMLITMNAKILNIVTLKEDAVTITGFSSTLQEVTEETSELQSIIEEALAEEQGLADMLGLASVIENGKVEVEKIVEITISIQEFVTIGTDNTETINGFTATLDGITDVLLVTPVTVQELKDIVKELKTIKESNTKPDNIDALKMAAEDVAEAFEESSSAIQSEIASKQTIKITKIVEKTLEDIKMSFSELIDSFTAEQLIGEDIEELNKITEIAKIISSNTDSATKEDVALLQETFAAAQEKLSLLSGEQGVGNLVATLTAVEKATESSMKRLSELEDLKEIEMEEQSLEKISLLLQEVKTEIDSKITAIGDITTTDSNEEVAEIKGLKEIMEEYISKVFEKTDTDLQTTLDQFKGITVTAGQEISGLFDLQSMTLQATAVVEEEQQFIMTAKDSLNEKTILSQASTELTALQLEFTSLKTFFEGNQEEQATLFIMEDIKILLSEMESTEAITFDTVKELKRLNKELTVAYTLSNIDTGIFEEVETQISSIAENIEESLQEIAVTSEERATVTTLQASSKVISKVKSVFELISVDSATEDNADIEAFVALLTGIQEVGSVNAVQLKEMKRLEEAFTKLESISEQDVTLKDDALNLMEEVSVIISEELSSTQTAVTITAKSAVLNKAADAMKSIVDITSKLISEIGLATEESPNEDVASLITAIQEMSITSLTIEQITQIETSTEKLMAITVTEGNGITDLLVLKSVTETKLQELSSNDAVLGKTKKETTSLKFVTAVETVVKNLKKELTDILDNSEVSGSDVSSVITEIADILVDDVGSMTVQEVEELEEKYSTLVLIKTTITGGAEAISDVVSTLSVLQESVMEKKSEIEKGQRKNSQIAIFMETESTLTKISEMTSNILEIGEETAESEENEDVLSLIKSLTMFESNVLGITKTTLGELNSKMSVLQTLVAQKKVVKGITQLSDLSSTVQSTVAGEISMIVADNTKKDAIEIKQKYQESVISLKQVFEDILVAVGDGSDGESIESEEITQATTILKKISDSSATEKELQTLDDLIVVLQESTFEQGTIITNLESAITLVNDIDESLAGGLTEDVFDLSYADELFTKKEEVALLSQAESMLTSTLTEGADISDEAFDTILESMKEIKEQASSIMSSSFSTSLDKLVTGSADMTKEKKVEGLKTLQRMLSSAIVTQSLSISQGSASESSGATFELIKKAEEKLSGIEVLLASIKEKVSASGGSGTSMELVEFTNFRSFLQGGAYDSEDIAFMTSFSEVLTSVISKLEEGEVSEIMMLDDLMIAVKEEKAIVSNEVITAKRNVIKEKQSVYSEAACKTIRNNYQSVLSLAAEASGDISEIAEVTEFYFKLQKIDIATMSAVEIKMIEEGMASIISSISTAPGGVAFLSNIIETLTFIDVRGAEVVGRKQAVGNNKIIEKSLGMAEETLQTSLEDLMSVQATIGVLSEDAEYTEDTTVTDAYNLLVQYSADLRLVLDFGDLLGAIDFKAITGTKGTGIKYFNELISLTTQYITASQQSKEFVAQSESVDQSFELESSITRCMDALEGFAFGATGSTGDTEETTDTGEEDEGTGGTGDTGESTDTEGENGGESETGDMDGALDSSQDR
nr:uncharacterized protein LOC113803251 [Penaeus vannamei]